MQGAAILSGLSEIPAAFCERNIHQTLNPKDIPEGVTNAEDWIVYRNGSTLKVYDRVCDHNGGRLISNNGKITCPMHGWSLDAATGRYVNVDCEKKPLLIADGIQSGETLKFETPRRKRCLQGFTTPHRVEVEFLNHACLLFRGNGISFATDPWLIGPAFSNGWWLSLPTAQDVFDKLNACDFIFISHNHPDHLHRETLDHIRKDMPILTAAFTTGSTERYLRDLGFSEITAPSFDVSLVDARRELAFTVIKSGDFRDDSGLLVEIGAFTALLSVDSNFIDFHRFPQNVTVYASSFSSGASGFPLCFDDFTELEKQKTIVKNKNVVRQMKLDNIAEMQPKAFLPYAGFFAERAPRDAFVKVNNHKNSVLDYQRGCDELGVTLLDVTRDGCFVFDGEKLVEQKRKCGPYLDDSSISEYIAASKSEYGDLQSVEVETYFLQSGYRKNFNLLIRLTDDEFDQGEEAFYCRFFVDQDPLVELIDRGAYENLLDSLDRYLSIRVRKAEFIKVIRLGMPWEDLSIGFQCRVQRKPNVYNSEFWYHFTNVYVNDRVQRDSLKCDTCVKLQHQLSGLADAG